MANGIINTSNERPLSSHNTIFCAQRRRTQPVEEDELTAPLFTFPYTHSFYPPYFYVGYKLPESHKIAPSAEHDDQP